MKIETKTIDEKNITIHKKSVREGLALKSRLLKILGGGLTKGATILFDAARNRDAESDSFSIEKLAPVIADIFERLETETVLSLIDELVKGVFVDGVDLSDEDKFEMVFEDNYPLLYKVLGAAIQVHFKGFFSSLNISELLDTVTEK